MTRIAKQWLRDIQQRRDQSGLEVVRSGGGGLHLHHTRCNVTVQPQSGLIFPLAAALWNEANLKQDNVRSRKSNRL